MHVCYCARYHDNANAKQQSLLTNLKSSKPKWLLQMSRTQAHNNQASANLRARRRLAGTSQTFTPTWQSRTQKAYP